MSCRRNRVTPDGDIVAIPARGRLMGNRGRLMNERGEVVRHFERERWISCVLDEVHGGPVAMDDHTRYTPLFFTDDAVALAAGHRPCGQCRTDDYGRFLSAWKRMQGISSHIRVYSEEMDADLHARRMRWKNGRGFRAVPFNEIPAGAFLRSDRLSQYSLLYWDGRLWPWAKGYYLAPIDVPSNMESVAGPWHFGWSIIKANGVDLSEWPNLERNGQ